MLTKIAKTSMQTKLVRKDSDLLADIVVKSVMAVTEKKVKIMKLILMILK